MTLDWRPFFPLTSPRHEQAKALDFIVDELYVKGNDFAVCELPTGVGKSAIAVTIGRLAYSIPSTIDEEDGRQTFILTSQKVLQDQYVEDFSAHVADLRSSANFKCHGIKGQSCGETSRLRKAFEGNPCAAIIGCNDDFGCPYRAAKCRFLDASIGVTNYSYLLSETVYAGALRPRELLVLDECHRVEDEVRKWSTIETDETACQKLSLPLPTKPEDVERFVVDAYAPALSLLISKQLALMEGLMLKRKLTKHLKELVAEHEKLDKHLCQVNRYVLEKGTPRSEYLTTFGNDKNGKRTLQLRPLNVSGQANDLLYSKGRKRLLMSATVLDKDVFFRSAGVPRSASYISLPSPFSPKSFGITYRPAGKMATNQIQATLPKLIESVKQVLAAHPEEKGVIHTNAYHITQAISKINDPRLLVQTKSDDRERMLREHLRSPRPTVLVSPAMTEGIDLPDDMGRFQVICKVPYPYLGDAVVAAKLKKDPKWYAWCTVRVIVQAVGRCVRHSEDHAKTYILDECFWDLMQRNPNMFPECFEAMDVE